MHETGYLAVLLHHLLALSHMIVNSSRWHDDDPNDNEKRIHNFLLSFRPFVDDLDSPSLVSLQHSVVDDILDARHLNDSSLFEIQFPRREERRSKLRSFSHRISNEEFAFRIAEVCEVQ